MSQRRHWSLGLSLASVIAVAVFICLFWHHGQKMEVILNQADFSAEVYLDKDKARLKASIARNHEDIENLNKMYREGKISSGPWTKDERPEALIWIKMFVSFSGNKSHADLRPYWLGFYRVRIKDYSCNIEYVPYPHLVSSYEDENFDSQVNLISRDESLTLLIGDYTDGYCFKVFSQPPGSPFVIKSGDQLTLLIKYDDGKVESNEIPVVCRTDYLK